MYFANNATFTLIESRFGVEGLYRYWSGLDRVYQRPVWKWWRDGGLSAVAAYWRAFFATEPDAKVKVTEEDGGDQVLQEYWREAISCNAETEAVQAFMRGEGGARLSWEADSERVRCGN